MRPVRIVAFDTALATWGMVAIDIVPGTRDVTFCALRVSAPQVTLNDSQRLRQHFAAARAWLDLYSAGSGPVGVEALAYMPGRIRWSTLSALARARQIVDDVLFPALPVEVPAREVAVAAVDRQGKATKEQRINALRARFPKFDEAVVHGLADGWLRKSQVEHVADAFAVALCVAARLPARGGELAGRDTDND